MNKYLIKLSFLIQQYQHDETGQLVWHKEGDPLPGKGWSKVKGHAKYVRPGSKK